MKKLLAAAIGLIAMGAVAASANAAPISGAKALAEVNTQASDVIKVHGVHRACRLDWRGWHRSPYPGARKWCKPHRHHWHKRRHHHKHKHHHHRRHKH